MDKVLSWRDWETITDLLHLKLNSELSAGWKAQKTVIFYLTTEHRLQPCKLLPILLCCPDRFQGSEGNSVPMICSIFGLSAETATPGQRGVSADSFILVELKQNHPLVLYTPPTRYPVATTLGHYLPEPSSNTWPRSKSLFNPVSTAWAIGCLCSDLFKPMKALLIHKSLCNNKKSWANARTDLQHVNWQQQHNLESRFIGREVASFNHKFTRMGKSQFS